MRKNVMVVDDDQEMLLSLKDGLEKYDETLSVMMAGDGLVALEKLKENAVSLVVADLKMPRMDGLSLMTEMNRHYPDIPVIVITGYSTPETEYLAQKGGAAGYVEKPFMVNDLAGQIQSVLEDSADGGTLNNVSSGMFLQLMEMEERTCTIRLTENVSGRQGVLFFKEGELLDARLNGLRAESAAYEIFSWEEVSLSIQNVCPVKDKIIESDLRAILLEAMRLKDEQEDTRKQAVSETVKEEALEGVQSEKQGPESFTEKIRAGLKDVLGGRAAQADVYQDPSWDGIMVEIARAGALFDAGELKVGYVSKHQAKDFMLLPGQDKTTVITVDRKCPRDRLMEILGERA